MKKYQEYKRNKREKPYNPKEELKLKHKYYLLKEAISNADFHQMEYLTHITKGSATNMLKLLIF